MWRMRGHQRTEVTMTTTVDDATMRRAGRPVTQFQSGFLRRFSADIRDDDRRRAGQALTVTLRMAGLSGKRAARILEVHESTVSRRMDGRHDTPVSRVREIIRKLTQGGAFPAPIIADLLADAWRETVTGLTADEIRARMKTLHREEQRHQADVDLWQMADMGDVPPECEEAVDEALLSQIARLVELYALRQEKRALERRR